jgi:polyhydroxyalkanoate synthesis regulator protein
MIRLVKYNNNKMYNGQTHRYVKLSEIKELIQAGETIQVLDYDNGTDITAHVLSQVLTITNKVSPEAIRTLIQKGE